MLKYFTAKFRIIRYLVALFSWLTWTQPAHNFCFCSKLNYKSVLLLSMLKFKSISFFINLCFWFLQFHLSLYRLLVICVHPCINLTAKFSINKLLSCLHFRKSLKFQATQTFKAVLIYLFFYRPISHQYQPCSFPCILSDSPTNNLCYSSCLYFDYAEMKTHSM